MPSLTPDQQAGMLGGESTCFACGETLVKNYCRQCDEFFGEGHKPDCPEMDKSKPYSENHRGHRTY